jgi:cytochrome oxidase assembly protein ShyY1
MAGFAGRDWQPTTMGPDKHRGYAVQWFALAATAFIAWLVLGSIRAKERNA